jgi:hypothetical protein
MKLARSRIWIGALLLTGACFDDAPQRESTGPSDETSADDASSELEACVDLAEHITEDDLVPHLEALQAIANANGNRRSIGTEGYDQSVAYVRARLEAFGYEVTEHEIDVDVAGQIRRTTSVLAETDAGDPDEVVMLGAHLDSVPTGPGINDNGTGIAALLEVARVVHGCDSTRRIRFAWWAAEEAMLAGSTAYVESLSDDERDAIVAYLNFDMIGSPNYVRFVYDVSSPPGSGDIEDAFLDYFDDEGLEVEPIGYSGRSDHVAFFEHGIAIGGLFTGADMAMTADEAHTYDGQAGAAYDACYHDACDDIDNVDFEVLETMGRAIAHAVEVLAM